MDCCKENKEKPSTFFQKYKLMFLCIGGIITMYIVLKILNIKIGTILPYGIILLCPLMHIFMMKGHGEHQNKNSEHQH